MARKKHLLLGLTLLLFCAVSISADFFHTETNGRFDPKCPACQFHASALGEQSRCFELLAVLGDSNPIFFDFLLHLGSIAPPTTIFLRGPPTV